jgi:hypothetical protein
MALTHQFCFDHVMSSSSFSLSSLLFFSSVHNHLYRSTGLTLLFFHCSYYGYFMLQVQQSYQGMSFYYGYFILQPKSVWTTYSLHSKLCHINFVLNQTSLTLNSFTEKYISNYNIKLVSLNSP